MQSIIRGNKELVDELVNQEVLYLNAVEASSIKKRLKAKWKSQENVLKQYALQKLLSGISATEDEIKSYYDEHKEYFVKPESIRASHILVEEEEEADEIFKEIEEGLSFEEAASKYSLCPSKEMVAI